MPETERRTEGDFPESATKLTYSNVIAGLALFVALGGVAVAAGLPKNSVGPKQLKNGAVTAKKLRKKRWAPPASWPRGRSSASASSGQWRGDFRASSATVPSAPRDRWPTAR